MDKTPISVLVIDDEAGLAHTLRRYLERFGYVVSAITDGQTAVDFYQRNRPDIVLIDILLGEDSIDGIEVLKNIRRLDAEALCIMTTRVTDETSVKQAKELGALHYVLKPLSGHDVAGIVHDAAQCFKQRSIGRGQ